VDRNRLQADSLLIVVPAKSKSKRLPGKVLREVYGWPLIWYTLDYIRRIGRENQAVVVTDGDDVADAVRSINPRIGIVMEPPVEHESTPKALAWAIAQERERGRLVDAVCSMEPTRPVRPLDQLDRMLPSLTTAVDGVRSLVRADMPVEFHCRVDESGLLRWCGKVDLSQNLLPSYVPGCGVELYWADAMQPDDTVVSFYQRASLRGCVHDGPACDIDTQADLDWFTFLVKTKRTIWQPAVLSL